MATRKSTTPGKDSQVGDSDVAIETLRKEKLAKPPLFQVLFHNDNYTTMEFVVWVLQSIFLKSESDAMAIMLNIHRSGMGVAGVYSKEIAETKIEKTHALAREHEFPLKLTMEPEEL
jgi:ATP-dependent Clp protease adaptor protein ClpS